MSSKKSDENKQVKKYIKSLSKKEKIAYAIAKEDLPIISEFIMTLPDYINIDDIVIGMFNKQTFPGKPTTQWGVYANGWF